MKKRKTLTIVDAYKKFEDKSIPYQEYAKILEDFFKFIIQQVFKSYEVKLPERFGTLQMVGTRIKPTINKETGEIGRGLAPDWKTTKKFWENNPIAKEKKEVIYFLNEHTQRVRYRVHWSKRHIYHENKELYTFRLSRANRRTVKPLIQNGAEFQILN